MGVTTSCHGQMYTGESKVERELKKKKKCFKRSQPQRNISWLTETVIKRYIVERTSKAELRPEEQSEKAESCRKNL